MAARRLDDAVHDPSKDFSLALGGEQPPAGHRFPQHDGSCKHIRLTRHRVAEHLLGRKVAELTLELSFAGRVEFPERLRHTEVEHACDAVDADENVLRGHVTVNEAQRFAEVARRLMRGVQAMKRLNEYPSGDVDRNERSELERASQQRSERLPLHVLHHQEQLVAVCHDIVCRYHVGMSDASGESRLIEKHGDELRIERELRMQSLDRDRTRETALSGKAPHVNGRHASGRDPIEDRIATHKEGRSLSRWHHKLEDIIAQLALKRTRYQVIGWAVRMRRGGDVHRSRTTHAPYKRNALSACAAVLLAFGPAMACTSILGIDHDYRVVGADGGAAGLPDVGHGAGEEGGGSGPNDGGADADSAADAGEEFPHDAGAVTKVVAGKFHTCALFASGFAKCWGRNDDYQELGNGSMLSTAVPLPAMSGGLSDLFAGAHQTCATVDGGAVCAGRGEDGELSNGVDANSAIPVGLAGFPSPPTAIASGETFMCALVSTGDIWCVGAGPHGELGDGTVRTSASPVRVQLPGPAQALAAYNGHACALVTDGTVACWGDDSSGQLGNGRVTPDAGVAVPSAVQGIAGATAIGVGVEHSCALTGSGRAGSVWCWGGNSYGQLGNGSTALSPTPVQVQGSAGATSLAVGGLHACAGMLVAGIVKCWGKGGSGELGNGRSSDSPTPVTVQTISYPESLTAGGYHTCALVSSPNVVCWGSNDFGQLGNGNAPNQQNQPGQVSW